MPDLSFAEVGEILHLLQRVDAADVTLEWGDLKVHVRRGVAPATGAAPAVSETPVETSAEAVAEPLRQPGGAPGHVAGPGAPPSEPAAADDVPTHWVAVKAPMVGTFYRAPKPDEPPFADVGDVVAAGDTVGLIEVMKLFTELTSEVAGKVARVDVDAGTLVEYDQPLLWIEPS